MIPLVQIPSKLEELQIGFRRSMVPVLEIASKSAEFLNGLEIRNGIDYWASQQPLYIDVAVSIARGVAVGCLVPLALREPCNVPRVALLWGSSGGISAISHRLKGVKGVKGKRRHDVQTELISGFAATYLYYLADGKQRLIPCLLVSLLCGGLLKLQKKLSKPQEENPSYMKTKGVLKNLGRDTYEKNFKKGMLIDST